MKFLKNGLIAIFFAMLYVVFMVLLWLRPLIKFVLETFGGLSFVAALIYGGLGAFSGNIHWPIVLPLLICSFVAFVLSWIFDSIILAISPEDLWLFD